MKLEKYISDLLYRYDCVIVPNFGGFIANKKSATVNQHTFLPPYKQITFNSLLIENDGLLANYIAQVDKMPYATAINFINFEVQEWVEKLLNEQLDLDGIGTLFNVKDTIEFEPENKINYLTDSFGLKSIVANKIIHQKQGNNFSKIIATTEATSYVVNRNIEDKNPPIVLKKQNRNRSRMPFVKYAAIFILGATTIALMTKINKNSQQKQQLVTANTQQKIQEAKIQNATFVIDNPLPIIELKAKPIVKNYHIIAGAFRSEKNAKKKVKQLKNIGFEASIVGKNKFDLYQVAFESFANLENANDKLNKIKSSISKDAWMLVK